VPEEGQGRSKGVFHTAPIDMPSMDMPGSSKQDVLKLSWSHFDKGKARRQRAMPSNDW
jgi:hypothetical protein